MSKNIRLFKFETSDVRHKNVLRRWLGVLIAAIVGVSSITDPINWYFEEIVSHFEDIAPEEQVTIVGIDRNSLEVLGDQAFDPIIRARTIKNLLDAGATKIFVDFGMAQLGNDETAQEVVRLLGPDAKRRVAFPVFSASRNSAEGITKVDGRPDPVLQNTAAIASVSVPIDSDGSARRMFSSGIFEGEPIASAPHWLAARDGAFENEFRINFGIQIAAIPTLSLSDVLSNEYDHSLVQDKLVIIGATDLVLGDQLVVPRYSIIAGCEFLALATLTLISDLELTEIDPLFIVIFTVFMALAGGHVFSRMRPILVAIVTLSIITIVLICGTFAQSYAQFLIQPASPAIGLIVSSAIAILHRSGWMERQKLEDDQIITQQADLIGKFLASSRDGIITIAPNDQIAAINDALKTLWGEDPTGQDIVKLLPDFGALKTACLAQKGSLSETTLFTPIGSEIPIEVALSQSDHQDSEIWIAMLRDVRERKAHEDQLTELATHDALTGIANRYDFDCKLIDQIRISEEKKHKFHLILIDLDQFKEINDTLGHSVGDSILIAVAQRLKNFTDHVTSIARLGGDEFALLVADSDIYQSSEHLAETIHSEITDNYNLMGMTFEIGASLGIATYPQHGSDPEKLLQCADVAMYQAKRMGGGYQIYDIDQDENSVRKLTLKGQLRQAIENDELILYYQPKVSAKNGSLVGSEALVRWIHPEMGFMPPDEFIPAAEQSGLIEPLTIWCFQSALEAKTKMPAWMQKLPISVNVSARMLAQPEIVKIFLSELDRRNATPQDLTLEITESALMVQVDQSLAVLNELTEMGFKLSLDDFGAGYSSFDYLRRLPVKELKIDRAFLVARQLDNRASVILRGMIDLAHHLNLSVVCEGAETIEDVTWLQANECDIIQGYFTGRPSAINNFINEYNLEKSYI